MAKKNNKGRKRQYNEWLKEVERNNNMKKESKLANKSRKIEHDSGGDSISRDVIMDIIKVKKKNVKLDKKAQRRLNKLSNIKKNNIAIKL